VEIVFAAMLGLNSAVEDLRFRLYPGVYRPFTSEELSRCLKRDSELHLNQRIGLSEYRDLQSAFVNEHKDPDRLSVHSSDATEDLQQGHTSSIARDYYGLTPGDLRGAGKDTIKAYRRASSWWQHLTGKQTL